MHNWVSLSQKNAIFNAPIFQSKRHHLIPFMPFPCKINPNSSLKKQKNPIFFGGGVPFHGSIGKLINLLGASTQNPPKCPLNRVGTGGCG
jgi:hypothetical protein